MTRGEGEKDRSRVAGRRRGRQVMWDKRKDKGHDKRKNKWRASDGREGLITRGKLGLRKVKN